MLLVAPVELACRPDHAEDPLCDRDAALADVVERFGAESDFTVNGLQFICNGAIDRGSPVQECDREITEPTTVVAAAGHMHLLGESIRIEANPGRPGRHHRARHPAVGLRQPGLDSRWPSRCSSTSGDTLRVTCRHDQANRDLLPAFDGKPDRYVLWGEGTTDEMCLGIVMVTRP